MKLGVSFRNSANVPIDMAKLVVAFRNFANAPKNLQFVCLCGLYLLVADQHNEMLLPKFYSQH
jgi:hypothetical protein